jgi:hypothetical protein
LDNLAALSPANFPVKLLLLLLLPAAVACCTSGLAPLPIILEDSFKQGFDNLAAPIPEKAFSQSHCRCCCCCCCCCFLPRSGLAPLPISPEESFTQGFDNLAARCARYKAAGASFAKWRAVINIRPATATSPALPSEAAVAAAARGLALYAAISQAAGLVPIVEPEVLADGAHSIELCEAVTQRVLAAVFKELADAGGQAYLLLSCYP